MSQPTMLMSPALYCQRGSNRGVAPQKSRRNAYRAFPAGASAMRSAHPMGSPTSASIAALAFSSCFTAGANFSFPGRSSSKRIDPFSPPFPVAASNVPASRIASAMRSSTDAVTYFSMIGMQYPAYTVCALSAAATGISSTAFSE
ncbi:uncharacterized protein MICPUCDRAFT_39912 [Micromonas pusilla CCMP1545]|uniref:Predicted protein n=1 Tax=Micromonas pusilla (strain CCMP1545) TaxID=564608 RepID=C1MS10_MICPC|nr:uncharacterized protein MICPUCDRAFT_39912 [Micromonas pusilla CCMP1545]EEH57057.1 predicted protein [Micromonas pusilla CCMP1545]|eukprot:XP_003058602.1 predicted protein [Micromonas pusilla CCMP1545]